MQNAKPNVKMNANGKYDTKECVGTNGSITVIKDFGLKNPYVGKTQLVNGAIASISFLSKDLTIFFILSSLHLHSNLGVIGGISLG